MRRPRLTGEAAVNDAVLRLLEKFEYPDELGGGVAGAGGGGGGAPTVVVAGSDASDIAKSKADYVCTGTNDDNTVNEALGQLNTGSTGNGGRLLLTEGTYDIRASFIFLNDKVTVQGMGPSTVLDCPDSSGTVLSMGIETMISDLAITGLGGTSIQGIETQRDSMISQVYFDQLNRAIVSIHAGVQIIGCNATNGVVTFINSTVGGFDVVIAGNTGEGDYALGIGPGQALQGGVVVGNSLSNGDITGGLIRHMVIADNFIDGSILMQNNQLGEWNMISGNILDRGSILIEDKRNMTISDNLIRRAPTHGISLTDCDNMLVRDNNIVRPGNTATNTYDGIHLAGTCSENFITGNYIEGIGPSWNARYGVNVSAGTCVCNIVVGNRLGAVSDYGTDALNDAGADTQLFWPADPTYGDNFIGCYGS